MALHREVRTDKPLKSCECVACQKHMLYLAVLFSQPDDHSRLLLNTMGSHASVARLTSTSVPVSANLGTSTSRVRCPSEPAAADY
jgi:hypothetical protein